MRYKKNGSAGITDAGIRAKGKWRLKHITDSNRRMLITPNLLDWQFTVAEGLGRRPHLHPHRRELAVPGGGQHLRLNGAF